MSQRKPPADWEEVTIDSVRLRSPVTLTQSGAVGIDSAAGTWEGDDLGVTIDSGPLADPLTSYEGRHDARVGETTIGGRPARVVSFRLEDGRYLAAAHFDDQGAEGSGLTISVVGAEPVGEEVPLLMVESVEFV